MVVQMRTRRSRIQMVRMVAATANPEPIYEPLCRRNLRRPNVEEESAILSVSPASGLQAKTGRQHPNVAKRLPRSLEFKTPSWSRLEAKPVNKKTCSHLCQTHLQ